MKKILLFLSIFAFSVPAYCGTVSFDQLASSSDLTFAKYNGDLDRIYREFNSATASSNIQDDTVAETDMADNANPRIRTYEGASCEKVYSGLLPTTTSGTLVGSVPSGTAYPLGYRVVKSSSTPKTWSASKWTFVDIDINGDFTYSEVTIDGATPAIATNSIRLARVSTDGTQVIDVQDLRTTDCSASDFDFSDAASEATLDEILQTGASVRRFSPAGRTPGGWAQGAFVSWDTHTTFKVTPGSLYINGRYRRVSTDITVTTGNDAPNAGTSGLDTGAVTTSSQYCVYAVADQDAVKTYSITYSTDCTNPSGVTYYRKIGSLKTDGSSLFVSRDVVTSHGISEREIAGAWVRFDCSTGANIDDSYNISSTAYAAAGTCSATIDQDFNNANYAIATSSATDVSTTDAHICGPDQGTPPTAGLVSLLCQNDAGSNDDTENVSLIMFGDKRI